MPNRRSNLTQLAVDRLRPPDDGTTITLWDRALPGFGVRVSPKGRKTWLATYRVNGKPVMQTFGTTATVPRLADAREAARAAMARARSGVNPVEERRAAAASAEADKAASEAAAREAEEGRVEVVVLRFLAEHVDRNRAPGYAREVRRIFERDVLPRWGARPVRSITKHDVNELLDLKATTRQIPRRGTTGGAAIQSNRTLTRLRTFFKWCTSRDLALADPTAGVLPRGKERARDRFLDEDEIRWFWRAADAVGWPYGAIFKLLLLTAQREDEVAGMRWSELNLAARVWTIPRERTKSDRAHVVHLSDLAAETIDALPRIAGDIVFPGRTGDPVYSFFKPKRRLDLAMLAQKRAAGRGDAEIEPWIIHDLRRSATTIMAQIGVAPHVADRVLNHAGGTIHGVARTYNRFQYIDERKAALEALGRYVEGLVRPGTPSNVVAMRA